MFSIKLKVRFVTKTLLSMLLVVWISIVSNYLLVACSQNSTMDSGSVSTVSSPKLPSNISALPQKQNAPVSIIPVSSDQIAYDHFPYAQSKDDKLMIVASYATGEYQRFESMNVDAGTALMKMIYAAREQGVWIVPVSGFRTIENQDKLFKDQIKKKGSADSAAKVSAPPGHSEHHTGFALVFLEKAYQRIRLKILFLKLVGHQRVSEKG